MDCRTTESRGNQLRLLYFMWLMQFIYFVNVLLRFGIEGEVVYLLMTLLAMIIETWLFSRLVLFVVGANATDFYSAIERLSNERGTTIKVSYTRPMVGMQNTGICSEFSEEESV